MIDAELKSFLQSASKLMVIVLSIGLLSAIVWSIAFTDFVNDDLPQKFPDFFDIFWNNIKFIFIFMLPIGGWLYFGVTFFYIFILIGISLAYNGIFFTFSHLIHLPFELYAFSLAIIVSKQCWKDLFQSKKRTKIKNILFAILISIGSLLIAAFVESILV